MIQKNDIKEKIIGTSYHDIYVLASAKEISTKIKVEPVKKLPYEWHLFDDKNNINFTIYDFDGYANNENEVIKYHIGTHTQEESETICIELSNLGLKVFDAKQDYRYTNNREEIYSYHTKHDKIFISKLPYSCYIYLGDKHGMKMSAISQNEKELCEDIDYVIAHCNTKSARRWFMRQVLYHF